MTRLSVFVHVVLLLFGLKVTNCSANTELIIPPSKYEPLLDNQSDRPSTSDIVSLLPPNPTSLSPPPTSDAVTLINALSTSPYLLSSLPPLMIIKVINEVSSSLSLLRSIRPSTIASLFGALCSSPSLLKHSSGATALIDLTTAVVLSPGMENALPPSIIIRLLSKIQAEAPNALCSLAPAIRVQLIITACTANALSTLKPTEIAFLVDLFASAECVLTETPPYILAEVLKTIASSPALTSDISISRIVRLLYRMSLIAPTLLSVITQEMAQALLTPFNILTINSQSPTTLLQLTDVVTSLPYMLDSVGPSILSSLLTRLSQPTILQALSPKTVIKLLTDITLSNKLLKALDSDAVVNILNSIATVSPLTICNIPPSVCYEYVILLVNSKLSIKTKVKFIGTLANTPCLFAQLSPILISKIISSIASDKELLNAIPLNSIICFIESVTALSPRILQGTPSDDISKLLSPLFVSLNSRNYIKLLISIASSPSLFDAISKDQILNIFTIMNSSPGILRDIPIKVLTDIFSHIFTTSKLLTKLPLSLILDLMINIENQVPHVICTIPSFAISAFTSYLEKGHSNLTLLLPADVVRVVYVLEKFPCILSQVSIQYLNDLLNLIASSSTILNAIPAGTKVDFLYSIYSIAPSILCSLLPKSILEIINSFDSFESLGILSPQHLLKFTTLLSDCPCLLKLLTSNTLKNLLEVLSAIPSALSAIKAPVVMNLVTSISSNSSLPARTYVRFLRALSTANLSLPCVIPTSVSAKLLDSLKSPEGVNDLMSSDVEILVDLMTTTPGLLPELPTDVLVNTIAALAQTFTTVVPRPKIITLLTQINAVSPSLLCSVPKEVLAAVLNTLCSQTELNGLPSAYVASLATLLSSSPCLLNVMPAPAFVSFLGLLSSSVGALRQIPSNIFANLLAKLLLTPHLLARAKLSLIIPLLFALFTASGPLAGCNLPPVLLDALLAATCDVKTIYALEPTEVTLLLNVVASVPCVLDAIPSLALDTLVSKLASSPNFLAHVSPSLTTSFLTAMASSPTALLSIRPMTLINALITIASQQPSVLTILPLSAATNILSTFNNLQALGSLPSPLITGFLQLVLTSPNLFVAMPLSTLDCLLRFLSSSPAILGSIPSRTIIKLLTVLSSLPQLLTAISSSTLTLLIAALSNLSPQLLCSLPPPVITTLISSITSNTALALSSPTSVSALICILNRLPCLSTTLQIPLLISLLSYLSAHPNLLSATPKYELVKLVNRIQSPGSFSPNEPSGLPFIINRFDKLSHPQSPPSIICLDDFSKKNPALEVSPSINVKDPTIFTIYNDSKHLDSNENTTEESKIPNNLVPTLILPKKSKGADVYILPKNNKQSFIE